MHFQLEEYEVENQILKKKNEIMFTIKFMTWEFYSDWENGRNFISQLIMLSDSVKQYFQHWIFTYNYNLCGYILN